MTFDQYQQLLDADDDAESDREYFTDTLGRGVGLPRIQMVAHAGRSMEPKQTYGQCLSSHSAGNHVLQKNPFCPLCTDSATVEEEN